MPEATPENEQRYLRARSQHESFTRILEAMNVFGVEAPVTDEFELRTNVSNFLWLQAGYSEQRAHDASQRLVPYVDNYREACKTERLAYRVAPYVAGAAMYFYMTEERLVDIRNLGAVYDEAAAVMPGVKPVDAARALQREVSVRTAMTADAVSMSGSRDEVKRFGRGLRALLQANALGPRDYARRLKESKGKV